MTVLDKPTLPTSDWWSIDQLIPSDTNVRDDEDADVEGLLESIVARGIISPLAVTPEGGIIAGHRRRRAILLGIETGVLPTEYLFPVFIKYDSTSDNLTQDMLIENMQRKDLNPIEQARAFQRQQDLLGFTQKELAASVGLSPTLVSQRLRLLTLPEPIIHQVQIGTLEVSLAEEYTKVADFPDDIASMVERKFELHQIQNAVARLKGARKLNEMAKTIEAQGATVYTSHGDMSRAGFIPDYDNAMSNPSKEDIETHVDDGDHVLIMSKHDGFTIQIGIQPEPTQKPDGEADTADDLQKIVNRANKERRAAVGDAVRTNTPQKGDVENFLIEYVTRSVGTNVAKMACRFLGIVDSDVMEEQQVSEKFSIDWGKALAGEFDKSGRAATQAKMALVMGYLESTGSERDNSSHHDLFVQAFDALGIVLGEHNAPVYDE
jgi:ParB family chromosome partitioning protein